MKIVLASANKHKLIEMRAILSALNIELVSSSEEGFFNEVEETGMTFEENALIKAQAVSNATGLTAIADDSGLVVDALKGEPGIYSARYSGKNAKDEANTELVLHNLQGVPFEKRTARFVCVIAFVSPNMESFTVRGEVEGIISFEKSGENGFGYDPIFYSPPHDKTFAQLDSDVKNKISHRSIALSKFVDRAKEVLF